MRWTEAVSRFCKPLKLLLMFIKPGGVGALALNGLANTIPVVHKTASAGQRHVVYPRKRV